MRRGRGVSEARLGRGVSGQLGRTELESSASEVGVEGTDGTPRSILACRGGWNWASEHELQVKTTLRTELCEERKSKLAQRALLASSAGLLG